MAYDHQRKAGNVGDVWKHTALCEVVSGLVQGLAKDEDFRYLDTHCGRPAYDLTTDPGESATGIGRFFTSPGDYPDCIYKSVILTPQRIEERSYPGSLTLVRDIARNSGRSCTMHAWDVDKEVVAAAHAGGFPDVEHGDGYAGAADILGKTNPPHLMLIDPPYKEPSDWDSIKRILEILPTSTVALVWFPLVWTAHPARVAWEDDRNTVFMLQWAALGRKPSRPLKGCGVLLKNCSVLARVERILDSVAAVLCSGPRRQRVSTTVSWRRT